MYPAFMALGPAQVLGILSTGEQLKTRQPDAAFLLAWAAWEGYLRRVALVGLQFQGLTLTDAETALEERSIWQARDRDRTQAAILGVPPANMPTYARQWHRLYVEPQVRNEKADGTKWRSRSYEDRRHQLVHGAASTRPRTLRMGVDLISELIRMPMFANCDVSIVSGDAAGRAVPLGNVLTRNRGGLGSRRGSSTCEQVLTDLGMA